MGAYGVDNKTSLSFSYNDIFWPPPSYLLCPRARNIFEGAENFTPDKKYFCPPKLESTPDTKNPTHYSKKFFSFTF